MTAPRVHFMVVVPDDDEGHALGHFEACAIPRVGDRFSIHEHPDVCRGDEDEFVAVVTDVVWVMRAEAGHGGHDYYADAVVHLSEEHQAVTLYCRCTPEHLASVAVTLTAEQLALVGRKQGDECESCSKTLRANR